MSAVHAEIDRDLADEVAEYYADPLGFARFAFPWGERGGPLANYGGPCPCQVKVLTALGEEIQRRAFDGVTPVEPVRIAVSSGHGIGKSVLAAILDNFIKSSRPGSVGTITANSYKQLRTKTWARIQEWTKYSITGHWFEVGASSSHFRGQQEKWSSTPQTCKEENSEAFAGQHAAQATSYYIFDEASAIPDKIFEVADPGGLTDGEPMIFLFGNPTRSQGKFYRVMFGSEGRRWRKIIIDSRDCPLTNKVELGELIAEHGEDSDIVRVRILGLPPKASDVQFIPNDWVWAAQKRPLVTPLDDEPLIVGCDLAWGGKDLTAIRFRRGMDARSIAPIRISGERSRDPNFLVMKLAEVLTKKYDGRRPAMLFLDAAGICGPVAQRLRQLGHSNVQEINFGAHSPSPKYKLMRSYMWGQVKEALGAGLCIDSSPDLEEDLTELQYKITNKTEILLESKEKLREEKRLSHSTDDGDALALTYAMPVEPDSNRPARFVGTSTGWT